MKQPPGVILNRVNGEAVTPEGLRLGESNVVRVATATLAALAGEAGGQ